jgi:hypothetical protein
VREPLLQAFPFPSTGKGDTAPALSGLRVYLQFMWEVGSSPLSSEVFLPLPLSEAFLLLLTGRCCCSCWPPCLFTVHVESGSSLLSCGVFLPPPLSQASPLLVAGCAHRSSQRLSGLPGLFIYSPGKDSLPPIFSAQGTPPSFQRVLTVLIAYYSVSLFFLLEVSLSTGLCCSGPGLSVGVPWYHEAHLVHVFPSRMGTSQWRPWGPSSFLHLT